VFLNRVSRKSFSPSFYERLRNFVYHLILEGLDLKNLILSLSIASAFASANAFASIDCATSNTLGIKGLACVNSQPNSQTVVTFREMPGWGGNSSLVMVDMCQVAAGSIAPSEDLANPITALSQNQIVEMNPTACIRRVCTQDMSSFSFRVSGLPIIPITAGFGIGISFGFSFAKFEVSCSLLGEEK
jgi:hypothetical protein